MAADVASDIAAETGNAVRGMGCGVTKEDELRALATAAAGAFGGIPTRVNTVGQGARREDPPAIPARDLVSSYRLNTVSAPRMSIAFLPWLRKGARGLAEVRDARFDTLRAATGPHGSRASCSSAPKASRRSAHGGSTPRARRAESAGLGRARHLP